MPCSDFIVKVAATLVYYCDMFNVLLVALCFVLSSVFLNKTSIQTSKLFCCPYCLIPCLDQVTDSWSRDEHAMAGVLFLLP